MKQNYAPPLTTDRRIVAEVRGASKVFQSGETKITALHPTTLELRAGELLLIIGPSGSGKTTLLSLLGCVIYPSEGEVIVDGTNATNLDDRALAKLRLRSIGFVFQSFNLVMPLTAEENVLMPLQLQGVPVAEARERAAHALNLVNMSHRRQSLPKQMSGGEQQRIAIARALVTEPPLMLCDEPTAALDPKSVDVVMDELRQLARQGKALAVVTHDMRLVPFADRVVQVANGQAVEQPPGADLSHH